jgi:hypothetical protein
MPLRDHAVEPFNGRFNRQSILGCWPATIIRELNATLPPNYRFGVRVFLGRYYELDIGGFDVERGFGETVDSDGGTAVLTAPAPTLTEFIDEPQEADYGVDIYELEATSPGKLVASIELVSPSNKDRPERRRAFTSKCANLWRQKVSVSIVDISHEADFNLYAETLEMIGKTDPSFKDAPNQYAATLRARDGLPGNRWRLESWAYPMSTGEPLPKIPVWLNDTEHVMLDLDATYEQTLRDLRLDSKPR